MKDNLTKLQEAVSNFDYHVKAGEYPNLCKPIIGTLLSANLIKPLPREVAIFSSEYARHVMIRPSNAFSQDYSFWVTHKGVYIPFTGWVDGGTHSPSEGVYAHLYSQLGHERIDRKWSGGSGYFDNFDEYERARLKLLDTITLKIVRGESLLLS